MIDFSKIKSKKEVGKCFDYAILPKQTTEQTIRDCCKEAIKYNCKAFCFSSSYWTPIVAEELKGTDILVGAAIGFPFGQQTSAVKAFETEEAVRMGATVLDNCMNVGALKDKILLFKLTLYQIMVAALAAILPAICEEFLFRGILFNTFLLVFRKEKYDILWTSIVCSILFGLYHLNNLTSQSLISTVGQVIITLGMGLFLSYLRVWSNGLIWCMVVHFLQDFSPKILSTDYGTSKIKLTVLVATLIVILMLICIYTINRRFLELSN